ncbi:MAG: flotillin-like protein FloA [Bacteroidales bacterium]|nr:flotillin-like protein FloA [Bacteroidales bacterium]MCF8337608.1 flotillin-like protein FloA [Bacteroidales bacterium]
MEGVAVYIAIGIASIFALWIIFYFIPVGLWFTALLSGVRISLLQLVFMRWRKIPPQVIVRSMISSTKAGLNLYRNDLEAHYLAGGHVRDVVNALISADKANMDIKFQTATAIDLAGRDVLEAVQMSVNPKVIETPPITAVAKDGIQLICKARVTVRANIRQLVGGAGEETVLARVGEGVVSSIGSAESHKSVLENPDSISRVVLEKGLDSGTAYEILSIDIADIDIGKNIGAGLQIDQANADKNIAQAKAEERRAMAVAQEQEMKAKAQEARAEVIQAEKQVPKAISEALVNGNLGVMDYYRFENIQADTNMRKSISEPSEESSQTGYEGGQIGQDEDEDSGNKPSDDKE